jgi:hypothetical protein
VKQILKISTIGRKAAPVGVPMLPAGRSDLYGELMLGKTKSEGTVFGCEVGFTVDVRMHDDARDAANAGRVRV